jgi:hypothetical protein
MKHDRKFLTCLDACTFVRDRLGFTPDPHQAKVLRSEIARGLLNCTRQWGKSTVTAAKAVHHAFTYPDSLVLVVSPSIRQSGEFVRKAAAFLRQLGIRRRGDGLNEVSLLLPNESRIIGLPAREDTIRGFSRPGLILIDEAARVPDEMLEAVRPMLATCDGPLWLMSTPHGKCGFFWEAWSGSTGESWTRISVPATECPRISRAFLDSERRVNGDRYFRQEYMCEFVSAEGQLFPDHYLERFLRDEPKLDLPWRFK